MTLKYEMGEHWQGQRIIIRNISTHKKSVKKPSRQWVLYIYIRPFVLGNVQKWDTPMSVEACPHRRFLALNSEFSLLIRELIVRLGSYWAAMVFNKGM